MTKRNFNLENVEWYTNTEHSYTDLGKEKDNVFEASVKRENNTIIITVYPLTLIHKDAKGWDYKIVELTEDNDVIYEYDAGAEHYTHFKTAEDAKQKALVTLKEMLGGC